MPIDQKFAGSVDLPVMTPFERRVVTNEPRDLAQTHRVGARSARKAAGVGEVWLPTTGAPAADPGTIDRVAASCLQPPTGGRARGSRESGALGELTLEPFS